VLRFLNVSLYPGERDSAYFATKRTARLNGLTAFCKALPMETSSLVKRHPGVPLGGQTLMELKEPEQLRLLTQFAESIYNIVHPAQIQTEPDSTQDIARYLSPAYDNPTVLGPRSGD
jgi:hypothetical protein